MAFVSNGKFPINVSSRKLKFFSGMYPSFIKWKI